MGVLGGRRHGDTEWCGAAGTSGWVGLAGDHEVRGGASDTAGWWDEHSRSRLRRTGGAGGAQAAQMTLPTGSTWPPC